MKREFSTIFLIPLVAVHKAPEHVWLTIILAGHLIGWKSDN